MPRILIVDDDENSRAALMDALDGEDVTLSEAADAEEAFRAVAADPPDLILLDILMSGMDGVQVCHVLKQADDTRKIPVIMVTALGAEWDVQRGLEVGATDYVAKPFNGDIVRARVRAALRSKLAHDEVEQLAAQVSAKNHRLAELVAGAHRFVDDVSHEFRAPLTAIKEFASIIADGLDGAVTEPQEEHLRIIIRAVDDLAMMVDDLLDSSKLRIGSLRVDRKAHRVEDIVASVRPIIAGRAKAKKGEVQEDIEPGLSAVFVDKEKAARVIVNLVINAIKFSREGDPIMLWAKSDESGDVEIGVTDHGPGLSPRELSVIFDRFKQVGPPGQGGAKGFGLGLSIAQELITLNLGEIRVVSEPKKGSTFSFTLPRNEPARILERHLDRLAEAAGPPKPLAALRVSVSDPKTDCEQVRSFLAAICYPMDLVLPGGDGRSLIAVGVTSEPHRWIRRLQSAWNSMTGDGAGEKGPEIDVKHVGSWPYHQHRDAALSCLLEHVATGAPCGGGGPHDR